MARSLGLSGCIFNSIAIVNFTSKSTTIHTIPVIIFKASPVATGITVPVFFVPGIMPHASYTCIPLFFFISSGNYQPSRKKIMNCPVCQAKGLPDELKKCPQCESDLEVFQLTRKIAKGRNTLLSITIITAILFIAVLLFWVLSQSSDNIAPEEAEHLRTENADLKAELENVSADKVRLLEEVEALKQEVARVEQEPVKREKEYTVREGESLYGIARKMYGNGFRYVDIARDNNIKDPDMIRAGQKLKIHD
jgi:LysM repeat protein